MTQTSRLVIEISTDAAKRNAEIIRQELQRMNTAGSNTINITNNISTNMNQAARSMDATRSAARDLIGMLGGMAVAYKAIHAADEWTGLKNRLILVTNSQQELNAAMSTTFDIAQKTGSSWENAAAVYQRFAQNAKELGINQARVAAITETVAKATALSGGSAQSASAALTQFGQALASGVLRGEEFNSVMEQAPGLAQALAKGLGIPVGQLRALAQEGKITAKAMIDALEKVAPAIAADFDKTAFTIGQNLTKIQNAVVEFVGESNGGAAGALADSLGKVAENLNLIANIAGAAAIGYITKAMVAGTTAGYARIAQLSAQIKLEQTAIAQTLRQALAEQNAATAEMSRARAAVTAAEMRVAADRQVIASNIQTLQSTQAQYRAELQLEQTRLAAQINQQGRTASITRMAQLRQAEAVVVRELQLAEAQLAATTAASSAQYAAARAAQTAATDRLAVATGRLNAAQAASAASAGLAARAGTGLMAIMGGPAGLIGLAVAAGAAFYLMRDSSDAASTSIDRQGKSVAQLAEEYKKLSLAQAIIESKALRESIEESEKAISQSIGRLQNLKMTGPFEKFDRELFNQIIADLEAGSNTGEQALKRLINSGKFEQSTIDSVAEYAKTIDTSKSKIEADEQATKLLNEVTKNLTTAANGATDAIKNQGNAAQTTAGQFNEATEALKKYLSQQQSSAWKTQFAATYSAKNNLPTDFSNMVAEARQANDNKPLTQQQTNDLWKYYQAQQAVTELDKRRNDAIKTGEKAVTDREKAEKKAHDEYLKQLEKQADMRKQISSQYANTLEQNRFNFADAKTDILGAGFSEKDQAKYIGLAQRFYQRIDDEYFKHLNLELKEYTWTEQQKLDYAYKMDKQILTNSIENLDEINEAKREALDRAYAYQSGQIALQERQDLLSTKQYYLSEIEYMKERYKLERDEIAQTKNKSDAWKAAKLAASVAAENEDFAQRQAAADLQYKGLTGELSGTGAFDGLDKEMEARQAIIENALKYQVITYQDYKDQLYAIDEDYRTKSIALTMSYGESIAGSYADIAKRVFGEQSNAYKAMFTIQKAASIAQSIMAIQTGIAQAAANPFPYNLAAMASVAAATANIVGNIQAIRLEGFSAGGYTGAGGKYDVAGLVHKGEVVWSQDDIKRAGGVGTVEAMRTGTRVDNAIAAQGRSSGSGGNVYVYNNTSSAVSTQKDEAGNTYITIDDVRKEIDSYVPAQLARPNSSISKGLKRNYNTETRR